MITLEVSKNSKCTVLKMKKKLGTFSYLWTVTFPHTPLRTEPVHDLLCALGSQGYICWE